MQYIFIIGCPRSGTTWLQLLLAQHEQIATAQETHMFRRYIEPALDRWHKEGQDVRRAGIADLITEDEFVLHQRQFAEFVFGKIAQNNTAATHILEKTPNNVQLGRTILKLFPSAHFIHIIRDPRDVATSLSAASKTWGASWAKNDAISNARRWVKDVKAGRDLAHMTSNYYELHYEDLQSTHQCSTLKNVFKSFGLEVDENRCMAILEACKIENLRKQEKALTARSVFENDPKGFYRKGRAGGWQDELTERDRGIIEHIAGKLMEQLGYEVGRTGLRSVVHLMASDAMQGWRSTLTRVGRKILG